MHGVRLGFFRSEAGIQSLLQHMGLCRTEVREAGDSQHEAWRLNFLERQAKEERKESLPQEPPGERALGQMLHYYFTYISQTPCSSAGVNFHSKQQTKSQPFLISPYRRAEPPYGSHRPNQ